MRFSRILDVVEWLPLAAIPVLIWEWSDSLTHSIDGELLLFLAIAAFINVGWIVFYRHARQQADFLKKFPGFRTKKHG